MLCKHCDLFSRINSDWCSASGICLTLLVLCPGYAKSDSQRISEVNAITPKVVSEAIFAAGCFWCIQKPYDELPGVIKTEVGYTGGHMKNPTYKQVSAGDTGHREAIRVMFDPDRVAYSELLDIFWHNIDPFNKAGQFCDKGSQYTTAIYYLDQQQKEAAETSKSIVARQSKIKGEIATVLIPAQPFYLAEEYHQSYYLKKPYHYKFERFKCGRDRRLKAVWGR